MLDVRPGMAYVLGEELENSLGMLDRSPAKTVSAEDGSTLRTLVNLWPYMWPADRPDLKLRVVWAIVFLVHRQGRR